MIGQLLQTIRGLDKAAVKKSGGLAVALGAALKTFMVAGVAIHSWAPLVALIPSWAPLAVSSVGILIYKILPKKQEEQIDELVNDAIDLATTIPQTYSDPTDFPNAPPQETGKTTPNNLMIKQPLE